MSNQNADYYFLRGGGEMGELIRAKDWGKTPLGNPADWPGSLCTMVSVMLDNPFGMYIAWGPEYTQLYNDGYRPILGTNKHPGALGISTRETFAEIWHIIGSMFEGVMKGKAVGYPDLMLPINRNGFAEECYFDFSYSPIRKDDGEVGGILVTVIETTHRKKAAEQIQYSDQRFRNTMKQAPVGIAILRGPSYIVEMANDAYMQLVDKKETDFVGSSLFASLPEVEAVVHPLLDSVLITGSPYHGNEVPIPLNRYGKQNVFYFDFLYHPLKEEDGTISGVVVVVTEATEKVEARKKIEESKRLYETITQNTPDLIYVFDLNYRFSYANEALLKMWGRSWDEAIGKSLLENGYEPWHAEMHEREIDQIIETKKPVRGEVSFPHAEFGKRVYDYILVPVINREGKVEAIAGTTRDITQQVQAREQIEESEMRFRNMVEQAPVAICVLRGENFVVEVANEKQLQLWGKTREQVLNKPIFTGIPEAIEQGFEQLLESVFTTGKPFVGNEFPITLIRNGKNETFFTNFVYEPLYDKENKIGGVISVATDVTERVIARKQIEDSEERFRSLAQTLPQLTWVTDANGNLEFASSRWKEYSGIEPGGEEEWKAIVYPDDYENINAAWQQSLATGNIYRHDVRLKNKEGEYRWHTVKAEPVSDKENKIVQWVGAFTDIQDQKIREEQKDEFISIASHEMKTPLTTAKAYLQMLELLLDEKNEDATLYAKRASHSVNRLNDLISELLDVSKIRLGKLNYTITTFNFNELIQETVDSVQLTSPGHTIIKAGLVHSEVTGDKERLQQVVINLLTNAIKYSPGASRVFIDVVQENDDLLVSVKDTGIGIAKQSLDKIFEKYHRVEEHASHFQGLGIGLFISYEIIQRHHGKLWAESEPGKGSSFYFTIPVSIHLTQVSPMTQAK